MSATERPDKAVVGITVRDQNDRITAMIDSRNAARTAKNFAEADRIRDELAAMGVILKDSKNPETGEPVTTWEIAR